MTRGIWFFGINDTTPVYWESRICRARSSKCRNNGICLCCFIMEHLLSGILRIAIKQIQACHKEKSEEQHINRSPADNQDLPLKPKSWSSIMVSIPVSPPSKACVQVEQIGIVRKFSLNCRRNSRYGLPVQIERISVC